MGHSCFKTTQINARFVPGYDNDIEKLTIVPAEAPALAKA